MFYLFALLTLAMVAWAASRRSAPSKGLSTSLVAASAAAVIFTPGLAYAGPIDTAFQVWGIVKAAFGLSWFLAGKAWVVLSFFFSLLPDMDLFWAWLPLVVVWLVFFFVPEFWGAFQKALNGLATVMKPIHGVLWEVKLFWVLALIFLFPLPLVAAILSSGKATRGFLVAGAVCAILHVTFGVHWALGYAVAIGALVAWWYLIATEDYRQHIANVLRHRAWYWGVPSLLVEKFHKLSWVCGHCGAKNPGTAFGCINCGRAKPGWCPHCQHEVPMGAKFCPHKGCGKEINPPPATAPCGHCGATGQPVGGTCGYCGHQVQQAPPPPPPGTAPATGAPGSVGTRGGPPPAGTVSAPPSGPAPRRGIPSHPSLRSARRTRGKRR